LSNGWVFFSSGTRSARPPGTPERNVDVAPGLRELAREDLAVKLKNATLGVDPAYGKAKTLRIVARDSQGRERVFEYAEGRWVDGTQFIGRGAGDWGDNGERRQPGRRPRPWQLPQPAHPPGQRRRRRAPADVTARVQQRVRDEHLQFKFTNVHLGIDPARATTRRWR